MCRETLNGSEPKAGHQIIAVEPEGVHAVVVDGEWEETEFAVDSGASESVTRADLPRSIPTTPGAASQRGVMYEVASGHHIANEGEKRSQARGRGRHQTFDDAGVRR